MVGNKFRSSLSIVSFLVSSWYPLSGQCSDTDRISESLHRSDQVAVLCDLSMLYNMCMQHFCGGCVSCTTQRSPLPPLLCCICRPLFPVLQNKLTCSTIESILTPSRDLGPSDSFKLQSKNQTPIGVPICILFPSPPLPLCQLSLPPNCCMSCPPNRFHRIHCFRTGTTTPTRAPCLWYPILTPARVVEIRQFIRYIKSLQTMLKHNICMKIFLMIQDSANITSFSNSHPNPKPHTFRASWQELPGCPRTL